MTHGCPVPTGPPTGAEDGTTRLDATILGIPAGWLDLKFHKGKAAGELLLGPLSAPIRSVDLHMATTGSKPGTVDIDAKDVTLRTVQWDIDGHTNMPGLPKAVWLDSAGATTGRIILDVQGEHTVHVDTNGRAYFKGFQVKKPSGLLHPMLQGAGCMYLLDDHMTVRLGGSAQNFIAEAYTFFKGQDWRCGEDGP